MRWPEADLKNGKKTWLSRDVTLLSPWHDQRLGRLPVLWGGHTWQQLSTLKVGDCVSAGRAFTSTRFILQKWPSGLGCSLQQGHFNRRNLKRAPILSCQPNEISNDHLKLRAYLSFNFFTSVRNTPTCMTALKKQVFPRLFMPLTGTKVLFTVAALPLGGSL